MKENEILSDEFVSVINEAVESLRRHEIESSRAHIINAITLNFDAPQPHNLLGILYELIGDNLTARKHYRAAYALDPTYKPACRNLERLITFEWGHKKSEIDYGIEQETQTSEKAHYFILK